MHFPQAQYGVMVAEQVLEDRRSTVAQAEHVYNMWLHNGILSRVVLLPSKTVPQRYPHTSVTYSRTKTMPISIPGTGISLPESKSIRIDDSFRRL